jgi:predicted SprT family Zn-dependent metalloprotease
MKITIDNKTHWRSDHIRAFIARCMKVERPDLCKRGAPALHVRIPYTRNGGDCSSGYAYYHSNRMTVRLPKNTTPDKVDFAFVITHELAHTRGMTHEKMRGSAHYRRVGRYREIYAWANDLPLERVEKKSKVKSTDQKLVHAQAMLAAAKTREKRATTIRKKWEAKVKYYAKKAVTPSVTFVETTDQFTSTDRILEASC